MSFILRHKRVQKIRAKKAAEYASRPKGKVFSALGEKKGLFSALKPKKAYG